MAILASAKSFEPLLPFFRYIAVWNFVVTITLTFFTRMGIAEFIALGLMFFGLVLNLSVGIVGQRAKQRHVKQSIPLPKYTLFVVILDLALFIVLVVANAFVMTRLILAEAALLFEQILVGHKYIGIMVGWHLQLFFGIVGAKLRRQHGPDAQKAREPEQYGGDGHVVHSAVDRNVYDGYNSVDMSNQNVQFKH